MESERGELIAVAKQCTLTAINNEKYTLTVPVSNARQGKRVIDSLKDSSAELFIRLTQITSSKDLPKLDLHLVHENLVSEHVHLGSVALYGLAYYTKMGKGISITLDVTSPFKDTLEHLNSMGDSIILSLIPRRTNRKLHNFKIASVELILLN